MQSLITAFKFYSNGGSIKSVQKTHFLQVLQKVLEEAIPQDIGIQLQEMEFDEENRIKITLNGKQQDDETFAIAIVKGIVGEVIEYKNLEVGQIMTGFCQSVGKIGFGVFVDAGVIHPSKQILVPLFNLRAQLCKDQKLPGRELLTKYGFMDNFPVQIEITAIEGSTESLPKIEAKFSSAFIDRLKEWIFSERNIVFTAGTARQMVKRAIAKRGHSQDILEVQRLGPLETAVICKDGTYAPGLISHVGPYLSDTRLSMLIPAQVRRFWKD